LNVYSLIGTVAPLSGGTSFLTLSSSFSSRFYVGNIAEFLYYPGGVTSSQRQQVEGYLAHKWGLTGYYTPTSPLSIPGCQLWLDGADATTVTGTTSVTAWTDKSSNVYSFTGNGAVFSNFVSSERRSLLFNGSSYLTNNSMSITNPFTVFTVAYQTTNTNATYQRLLNGISNTNYDYHLFVGCYGSNVATFIANGSSWNDVNANNPATRSFLTGTLICSTVSVGTITTYVNGITLDTKSGNTLPTFTGLNIGGGYGTLTNVGGQPWNGHIGEILFYNSVLTTTQRQTIEGYLARKWGLTSMYPALPSIHPFYSLRPHLRGFQPTDISGCQLWLDGADQSSLVLSGSNVTTWIDKSGNGKNATSQGTGAVYSNNGLLFTGSQTLLGSNATYLHNSANGTWSVFGVFQASTTSIGNPRIFNYRGTPNNVAQFLYIETGRFSSYISSSPEVQLTGSTVALNTTYLTSMVNTTSNTILYVNGTSNAAVNHGTNTTVSNSTYWIGGYNSVSDRFYGTLNELLVFSNNLSESQRQQVEGYLANKWGISISATLPSLHPFKSFPPATVSETFTNTFTYTGSDQSFVVPTNTTSIKVYMWAGGGQGSTTPNNGSFYGGAGAYVQGVLTVTPGETLTIYVGQRGTAGPTFAYKNGGYNSASDLGTGTGGGRSGIARSSTNIIAVGAGGGGGGSGNGGAGGITSGSAGTGTNPGGGGTQSAGGTAGSSSYNSGGVGQNFGGGTGPGGYGGSGGDGFYGGGGGAAFGSGQLGGGGGGGSSLTSNLTSLVTSVSSNGYSAPNTRSMYYISNVASGGYGTSGTAGNGLVVITSSI
jgi:hypothetical protein